MNYTDRWFEFPARVYDRYSAEKAMKEEEMIGAPAEGDWIPGRVKIPYTEITVWSDYFDSIQGIEKVREEGFDTTIVWTKNEGIFLCTLPKKRFEALLNKHVEEIEAAKREEQDVLIKKLRESGANVVVT